MMTEMFIESNRVDMSQDISALLTFAIDDIMDFGARNTTFSKTIVLPGSARNNKIFGNIFSTESTSLYNPALPNVLTNFNAAKSAKCFLFQGNVQVFKGVVRLLEIINDRGIIEYEVAVFGELGGFISALGNKKLEDINWAEFIVNYDLNYTLANITGSWDAIGAGDGIYFPLMDYGNYSTNKKDWDYHTFRPALYAKDYIDKIFYFSNYSYECDLFETARFKRLIIPHNQKQLTKLNNRIFQASNTVDQVFTSTNPKIFVLDTVTTAGSFTPNGTDDEFTYAGTTLNASIQSSISGEYNGGSIDFFLRIDRGGVILSHLLDNFSGSVAGVFSIDINSDFFQIQTGDKISIRAIAGDISGGATSLTIYPVTVTLLGEAALQVPITLGETLEMNDLVPRGILQKDFFSSILKLFNLYVYEDKEQSNLLVIKPYVDFYDTDPDTYIDWTHKMERDKPIRVKPMSELGSRYYEFLYKKDSDYYNDLYSKRYNESYGSRIYDSEYEFANEKNTLELIFAGTPLVGYSGEEKVYSTILKRSGSTSVQEENADSVIRILQAKKITGVTSYDVKDGASVLDSYTDYGYAGHLDDPDAPADDINFGVPRELFFTLPSGDLSVNQFNVYYSPYMAEITDKDSKLLTAHFRLTMLDIYNLDFSKYIYIDGSLWRLVKIDDYNASSEDLCKITLLKVIYTLY